MHNYIIENGYLYRSDDNSWRRTLTRWRCYIDSKARSLIPHPAFVVGMIVGANVGVYILWQRAAGFLRDVATPLLPYIPLRFMERNFTLSLASVEGGSRWWTLLTYSFSNYLSTRELLSTVYGLYAVGVPIGRATGSVNVLILYFGGALCGGLTHLLTSSGMNRMMMGSNCALLSMTAFLPTVFPHMSWSFYVLPIGAGLAYIVDGYGVAHLLPPFASVGFGILWGYVYRKWGRRLFN